MKQKAYPGSLHDLSGVERWLEEQSKQGLQLDGFTIWGKLAKFQESPFKGKRYYLEADFKQYSEETGNHAYDEAGWKCTCRVKDVFWVYETEDLWVIKPQREQIEDSKLRKKWRRLWLDWFFWMVGIGLAAWNFLELFVFESFSYYDYLTIAALLLILGFCTIGVELWQGSTKLYHIRIWNKYIRHGEDVQQWNGMKTIRWCEYYAFPILLTLCILALLLVNPMTSRSYRPLQSMSERDLPMVTLDVVEDEIYYAPEPYGPSIDVSLKRRLMIPEDIHINSIGMHENPGDLDAWVRADHIRNADAEMDFAYYQLWTKSVAEKLAADEAEIRRCNIIEHDTAFDAVWFNESTMWMGKETAQHLVALKGNLVIRVSYYGSSQIAEHLDEIYQIVIKYQEKR